MEKFSRINGLAAPLDRANVDTDQIIPKQFLRSISRAGFGPNLFDDWRYLDRGDIGMDNSMRPQNNEFVLNLSRYQGAEILLARENFGCGSSREHAVWALADYGFRAVVAPSFGDIFRINAAQNGFLAAAIDSADADKLFEEVAAALGYRLQIDLESKLITTPSGESIEFEIDDAARHRLLKGLDDIALTLSYADDIRAYESRRQNQEPWVFE